MDLGITARYIPQLRASNQAIRPSSTLRPIYTTQRRGNIVDRLPKHYIKRIRKIIIEFDSFASNCRLDTSITRYSFFQTTSKTNIHLSQAGTNFRHTGEPVHCRLLGYTKTMFIMIYLLKHTNASTMNCMYSPRYLRCMFKYLFVLVTLLCLFEHARCANVGNVCRMPDGDVFQNPFHANGGKDCANTNATCAKNWRTWTHKCRGCKCNSGTETYRADIMNCVSTKVLTDFTGERTKF